MRRVALTIAGLQMRDVVRSRWILVYTGFFFLLGSASAKPTPYVTAHTSKTPAEDEETTAIVERPFRRARKSGQMTVDHRSGNRSGGRSSRPQFR